MILRIIPLNPRSRYWLSSQAQGQRESNELRILPIHIQWSDQQYTILLLNFYVPDSKINTRIMWWKKCMLQRRQKVLEKNSTEAIFQNSPQNSMIEHQKECLTTPQAYNVIIHPSKMPILTAQCKEKVFGRKPAKNQYSHLTTTDAVRSVRAFFQLGFKPHET